MDYSSWDRIRLLFFFPLKEEPILSLNSALEGGIEENMYRVLGPRVDYFKVDLARKGTG